MSKLKHWPDSVSGLMAVGESFHREALRAVAKNTPHRSALTYLTATLSPEPGNAHDPNAVAVEFDGVTLAYLQREDAIRYRGALGAEVTTADAIISAGFKDGEREFDYSLELLMAFDAPPDPKSRRRPRYEAVVRSDPMPRIWASSEDGRVTVVVPYVATMAAASCWPGATLTVWTKEDIHDVHFFAPGSVGGSGRVVALPKALFGELNLRLDGIAAVVCFAGRNGVAFEFLPSAGRAIVASTVELRAAASAPNSLAWHIGRQVGRLLRR